MLQLLINGGRAHPGVMLFEIKDLFLQGVIKLPRFSLVRTATGLQGVKAVFAIKFVPFGDGGNGIVAQGTVRVQDAPF